MRNTHDHRGLVYWDVFPEIPGQINISVTYPLQKRGFHLHKNKTDHWFVAKGKMLVVTSLDMKAFSVHGLCEGEWITINPDIWHAYQNIGDDSSTLIYWETNKSGPDRTDDYEQPLDLFKEWHEA